MGYASFLVEEIQPVMLVRPRMASRHVIAQFPTEDPMDDARTSKVSEILVRRANLVVLKTRRAFIMTPDPQGKIVAMRGMVIALKSILPVMQAQQWSSLGLPFRGAPVTSLDHPERHADPVLSDKNLGLSDNRGARHG